MKNCDQMNLRHPDVRHDPAERVPARVGTVWSSPPDEEAYFPLRLENSRRHRRSTGRSPDVTTGNDRDNAPSEERRYSRINEER